GPVSRVSNHWPHHRSHHCHLRSSAAKSLTTLQPLPFPRLPCFPPSTQLNHLLSFVPPGAPQPTLVCNNPLRQIHHARFPINFCASFTFTHAAQSAVPSTQ